MYTATGSPETSRIALAQGRQAPGWLGVPVGFLVLAAEVAWFRRAARWNFEPLGGVADLRHLAGWLFPFLIFSVCVLIPGWRSSRPLAPPNTTSRWIPAAAHLFSFALFAALTLKLAAQTAESVSAFLLGTLWFLLGAASLAALGAASLPSRFLRLWNHQALIAGCAVALASLVVFPLFQSFWNDGSELTIRSVQAVLRTLGFHVFGAGKIVGTDRFSVRIAPTCSGFEGMGLFLAFSTAWLGWFRREYRFPAALLLLPAGLGISWALNVLRIALLILIGHYGHPETAVGGFHSQAGWIAFTLLAVGFCAISHRLPGIRAEIPGPRPVRVRIEDPAAVYLGPFVAVQAAAMISTAASGGFEWLYPLRVLAPVAVLLWYRKEYSKSVPAVSPHWSAAGIGVAVSAIWASAAWHSPASPGAMAHLRQLAVPWQAAWWLFRLSGAVVVAPVVEELAFRGYLMRRLRGPAVATLDPRLAGWLGIGLSSLAFGLLHGGRWMEGVAAGVAYGHVYQRRGRLGDAILAHATTNFILMAIVIGSGDWRFW